MTRLWKNLFVIILLFFSVEALAQHSLFIKMYKVSRSGKESYIGTIIAKDTRHGLLLIPYLHGLSPGFHGFHLHRYSSCRNFAKAAGDHWDPKKTDHHRGPYHLNGHKGDLPTLFVNALGVAKRKVLIPHLNVADLKGRSLIIHQGGDNYTGTPPNGGGGDRIACGVISP